MYIVVRLITKQEDLFRVRHFDFVFPNFRFDIFVSANGFNFILPIHGYYRRFVNYYIEAAILAPWFTSKKSISYLSVFL